MSATLELIVHSWRRGEQRVGGVKRVEIKIGTEFGRYTTISKTRITHRGHRKVTVVKCRCSCKAGTVRIIPIGNLRSGHSRSCGCRNREALLKAVIRHGFARRGKHSPEYRAFCAARTRCTNPKRACWQDYGGRGIEFRFASFEQFLKEIGHRPSPRHTLDRRNNDGHYGPGNVRWATRKQQANNRRRID